MLRFALTGNGPLTNRGCEAILVGTRAILQREFGAARFLLASFADDSRADLPPNVQPLALAWERPRWSRPWWRYQVRRLAGLPEDKAEFLEPLKGHIDGCTAALSIGGDGYAIDYGHHIVDRLIIMDRYVRAQGRPVVVWGASIGPFAREPQFEKAVARHLNAVELVVVREPVSLRYLASLSVEKNVCLAPDPAFAVEPEPCELDDDLAGLLEQPCIGLNLSPLLARHATDGDYGRWVELAGSVMKRLLNDPGLPLLLIPHVTGARHETGMDDAVFMRRAKDALGPADKGRVTLAPQGLNCRNLKWIIGRTTVFIAARTHAAISALSSHVPCLSIAYSRKARGINEWIFGDERWVMPAEALSPQRVCEGVGRMLDHRQALRSRLSEVIPSMVQQAYDAARAVRQILGNVTAEK